MADYTHAYSFCENLVADVPDGGTCLEFSAAASSRICAMLGNDKFTYLVVDTTTGYAELLVTCVDGKVTLDEPYDGTLPVGAQVYFDQGSPLNMAAWYECRQLEGATGSADLDIKSESLEVSMVDGQLCVELKEDRSEEADLKWEWCGTAFYVENGVIKSRASVNPLQDGVYPNATIAVEKGKIIGVTKGCAVVQSPTCDTCLDTKDGN